MYFLRHFRHRPSAARFERFSRLPLLHLLAFMATIVNHGGVYVKRELWPRQRSTCAWTAASRQTAHAVRFATDTSAGAVLVPTVPVTVAVTRPGPAPWNSPCCIAAAARCKRSAPRSA